MERRIDLDLMKGIGIIGVLLIHFLFIYFHLFKTTYFIWAVPLFIFATGAAYHKRIKEIKFKKILFSFLWINLILLVGMILCYMFNCYSYPGYGVPKDGIYGPFVSNMYHSNYYFYNIWYISIYFQILLFIFLISKIEKKYFKYKSTQLLIIILCIYLAYFPIKIYNVNLNNGFLTLYIYLIWLGLYHYDEIKTFFKKSKSSLLVSYILGSLILIYGVIKFYDFLFGYDYIFKTFATISVYDPFSFVIILEFFYFIIIFSFIELINRFKLKHLINILVFFGKYSLYIYIFHAMLFFGVFRDLFSNYSYNVSGVLKLILIIPLMLFMGYYLEKIHDYFKEKFMKFDFLKYSNSRRLDLDLLKAFGFIGIALWNFNFVNPDFLLFSIPLFILATSAAYSKRLENINLKKIIYRISWIVLIILSFTLLFKLIKVPTYYDGYLMYSGLFFFDFFTKEQYFGYLWYLLVYIYVLIDIYLISKVKQDYFKDYSILAIVSLFSIVSFYLLWKFNNIFSIANPFSWLFLIWFGIYHYDNIKLFFNRLSTKKNLIILVLTSLILSIIYYLGYRLFDKFIENPNQPFINNLLPLLCYFIIFFSIIELLERLNKKFKNTHPYLSSLPLYLSIIGRYSLYMYIFHRFVLALFIDLVNKEIAIIAIFVLIPIIAFFLEMLNQNIQKFLKIK